MILNFESEQGIALHTNYYNLQETDELLGHNTTLSSSFISLFVTLLNLNSM